MNRSRSNFRMPYASSRKPGLSSVPEWETPEELLNAGIRTRSIIGVGDEREVVRNPREDPWRRICSLHIVAQGGQTTGGTGWLVGPRTVVTAGHCVHNASVGGWVARIFVMPGRNGRAVNETDMVEAVHFEALKKWTDERQIDSDIGAIHLPVELGRKFGWFACTDLDDRSLFEHEIVVAGYPLERNGETMLRSDGRIRAVSRNRLFHDVDAMVGQSGSPLFTKTSPHRVVGVHAYAETETPREVGELNSASRITSPVYNEVLRWVSRSAQLYG